MPVASAADVGVLVRVTVASGSRRVDLAVPAGLPLVELVPDLALHTGVGGRHDPGGDGLAVLTPAGQGLDPERSLGDHGVTDGALLVLAPQHEMAEPRYDDPAAALADAVERAVPGVPAGAAHAAALAGGAALLALSGLGLAGWGWSGTDLARADGRAAALPAVTAAAATAGALALAASLASRARRRTAARVLALTAAWHGAVAGALVGWSVQPTSGPATLGAGVGALVAAVVCLVGMPGDHVALLPVAVVSLGTAAGGVAAAVWPAAVPVVVSGGLVLAVVAALPLPRLALAAARVGTTDEPSGPDGVVDAIRVEAQAWLAHRLVVGAEAGLGVLVVALAPLAAALAPAGAWLALAAGVTTLLRARRFRAASVAGVGVLAGGAALLLTATTVLALHPGARGAVAGLLLAAALALVVTPALRPGPGWHRAADVAESLGLAALAPLLLVATGAHHRVAGVAGSLLGGG